MCDATRSDGEGKKEIEWTEKGEKGEGLELAGAGWSWLELAGAGWS